MARCGERGYARDGARWTCLRPHCPTLDRLCRLEDLEQCPWGAALASESGAIEAILRFAACLPGEPVEGGPGLYARLFKNIPGRREAGKIFGDFYRDKLLGWGF